MGAALEFLKGAGVVITLVDSDRLAARGQLTDDIRRYIREHKVDLLHELVAANEPEPPDPLSAELRELVGLEAALGGLAEDAHAVLAIMRRQVLEEGVTVAELVSVMRLHLETHHAEAWQERLAIQAESAMDPGAETERRALAGAEQAILRTWGKDGK